MNIIFFYLVLRVGYCIYFVISRPGAEHRLDLSATRLTSSGTKRSNHRTGAATSLTREIWTSLQCWRGRRTGRSAVTLPGRLRVHRVQRGRQQGQDQVNINSSLTREFNINMKFSLFVQPEQLAVVQVDWSGGAAVLGRGRGGAVHPAAGPHPYPTPGWSRGTENYSQGRSSRMRCCCQSRTKGFNTMHLRWTSLFWTSTLEKIHCQVNHFKENSFNIRCKN